MTRNISVERGNCPCTLKPARELAGACDNAEVSTCALRDAFSDFQPTEVAHNPAAPGRVQLDVAGLAPLYGGDLGDLFVLATTPAVRRSITIVNPLRQPIEELNWVGADPRAEMLRLFEELRADGRRCAVLWIGDCEFEHYLVSQLDNVKLAAISFFSSPFTASTLARYFDILTQVDYQAEARLEARLLDHLDEARRIFFTSRFGTVARFDHQSALHWFSLHGALDYGQQTVLPTGELSTLTDASGEFSMNSPFLLDGEVPLTGRPVVHRGDAGVSKDETMQTYEAMSAMLQHPVIARVERGMIVEVRSPTSQGNRFLAAMDRLFEVDGRYRKIHEIGFGTSTVCGQRAPGNFFPNERWPGVHIGLGLGGYTPFHIDLTCTDVEVFTEQTSGDLVDIYADLGIR